MISGREVVITAEQAVRIYNFKWRGQAGQRVQRLGRLSRDGFLRRAMPSVSRRRLVARLLYAPLCVSPGAGRGRPARTATEGPPRPSALSSKRNSVSAIVSRLKKV